MKRRVALGVLGAAVACPGIVSAQRPALPTVGFLSLLPESTLLEQLLSFQEGLADAGQIIGRTVAMEFRWADGDSSRLAGLAAELVRLRPALIAAAGGNVSAAAAKAATSTIPIVFTAVRNPVQDGLVASLNRPGGNVTGVSILAEELDAKRLDLLQELAPSAGPVGVLINARNPSANVQHRNLQAAAKVLGRPLLIRQPTKPEEIDAAFEAFSAAGATGIVVASDPWFTSQRWRIVELAKRHRLPGIYQWKQFVEAGGLASYGPSFNEAYRLAGRLAGRVLSGEPPAIVPVQQPTRFEFIISLKAASAFGLALPSLVLARADEIIE